MTVEIPVDQSKSEAMAPDIDQEMTPEDLEPAVAEILERRTRNIGETALSSPKRTHVASGPTYEYRRWV